MKLMTMLAAAAMAFGLYADTVIADTGTSFEGLTVTEPVSLAENLTSITELSGTAGENWWGTIPAEAKITAYDGSQYAGARPQQYADSTQGNYLALKTGSDVLTRYVQAKDAGVVPPYAIADGSLYFDSLVKLTAFDEEITPDGKLALWLREVEDDSATADVNEAATNLMVSVNGGAGINCGDGSAYLDTWARVTIKAMKVKADGAMGFVVFIDTVPVTVGTVGVTGLLPEAQAYAEKGQLLVCTGDATIESVGFQGQGSVDDLVFTQAVPGDWAKDPDVAQIVLDERLLTDGVVVEISTNGVAIPLNTFPALVEKGATVFVKTDDTHMDATYEDVKGTLNIGWFDIKGAAATFTTGAGMTKYDAIDKAVAAATVEGTLKLLTGAQGLQLPAATGTVTIDLGGYGLTGYYENKNTINAQTGIVVSNGNVKAASPDYAISCGADCTIEDGDFIGDINCAGTLKVNGGRFFSGEPKNAVLPDGKKWATDKDNWFVLVDMEVWTVTVGDPLGDYVTGITATPTSYREDAIDDATVTLTATFEPGYELDCFTVSGAPIEGNTFILTRSVVINAVAKPSKVPVTGVSLDKNELALKVGDADVKLVATVSPDNATDKSVSWSSSAEGVATVGTDGTVHAVAAGEAIITVKTTDGEKTATCTVTVTADGPVVPSNMKDASPEQIAAYTEWADGLAKGESPIVIDRTDPDTAIAFAVGVTAEEITAAGAIKAAVAANLAKKITSDMVARIAAGELVNGKLEAGDFAIMEGNFTSADFTFVPATEIESTDTAKFYRLQAAFQPVEAAD